MEKEIFLSRENTAKVMRAFNTTRKTVWEALNFKSDSVLARKIRFTALKEYGGVASWKPMLMETEFDTSDNIMRQDFGNGVVLVVSLTTGEAMLGVGKENPATGERETQRVVEIASRLTIAGLMKLQDEAVKLSMSM